MIKHVQLARGHAAVFREICSEVLASAHQSHSQFDNFATLHFFAVVFLIRFFILFRFVSEFEQGLYAGDPEFPLFGSAHLEIGGRSIVKFHGETILRFGVCCGCQLQHLSDFPRHYFGDVVARDAAVTIVDPRSARLTPIQRTRKSELAIPCSSWGHRKQEHISFHRSAQRPIRVGANHLPLHHHR